MVVLFQGDSITDTGRNREDIQSLGEGYARKVAELFCGEYPDVKATFINKGIGGNRVTDLRDRWREDCIELKPDILSILVGVNDSASVVASDKPGTVEEYRSAYREILEQVRRELPNTEIIMLEPFVMPSKTNLITYREHLDLRVQVARELALEFADAYVPLDGLFAQQYAVTSPEKWSGDGVHPTQEGHALIAEHWMKAYRSL